MKCKKILIVCLAVLLLLPITGCGSQSGANKAIKFDLPAEPVTLDPQIANDYSSTITIEALYEGLVRLDASGNPTPGVATGWTSSDNNTVFTFTLRPDAKWSDGSPVTADDFVFAWQRALNPATKSTTCQTMFLIKNAQEIHNGVMPSSALGVTAVNATTLQIEINTPDPNFPALTASDVFMPCNQTFFESTNGRYGLDASQILGNGPFAMSNKYSWNHNQYINLVRSSTYVGDKSVLPSSLSFTIGALSNMSDANLLSSLTSKTYDAASIPSSIVSNAKNANCTVTSFEDSTWGLCFNTSASPMSNLALRKCFAQTIDRSSLVNFLPAEATSANDIIMPNINYMGENYRNVAGSNFILPQDNSVTQALPSILSSSKSTQLPSITILCPDDAQSKSLVNQLIAAWNAALGSYINMHPVSLDDLNSDVQSGNFQIALYPLRATNDDPGSVLSQFQSTSTDNPAALNSSEFDSDFNQAEGQDIQSAIAAYAKAEHYLNDQCIFYPLFYADRYYASAPGVSGIIYHPYDTGIDFTQAVK